MRVASLLLCACIAAHAANTAGVSGSVIDPTGKPVASAIVFVSQALPEAKAKRLVAPPVVTGPRVTTLTADKKGLFLIGSGLPAGDYVVCAESPTPGLLDPCHWSPAAPQFAVTAAQAAAGSVVTGITVSLAKGATVTVHLDDPGNQLKTNLTGAFDPELRVQFIAPRGHRYDAPITSNGNGAREYIITMPFDTALSLQVLSMKAAVQDSNGKSSDAGPQGVQFPSGNDSTTLQYKVTGSK